ncbi:MAG: sulfotransferase domain-containing protein [Chloroflexota bacterium]
MFKRLLSREKTAHPRDIYIVSGLPRSGTSMMMNMLAGGGLPAAVDSIRVADEDNPKGYYELEVVKQLREGKTDWLPSTQGQVVKVISYLLEFLPSNFHYKVIFMERPIEEILASQRKMLERRQEENNISDQEMRQQYVQHLSATKYWLARQSNIETLFVRYGDLLSDSKRNTLRIVQFLEIPLDLDAMVAVPDQSLYRNRSESK